MAATAVPIVDEMLPDQAYAELGAADDAALVDVRTRAEWIFTGLPDISAVGHPFWMVEWVRFPDMSPNPDFIEELVQRAGGQMPKHVFFICRSGARSMAAAHAVASAGLAERCTNVAEGFEGDLDGQRHRGGLNGWKANGLPWHQS